ncbi:hypothetical protein [Streptomyces sp. NPDC059003]|uniref:hypothetical protein n=1 Tax=Streptomyces sp. NPDC059003 TaxID=3346691 RepID=UPI0036895500
MSAVPQLPLFPPPAVPLRFADGDRYEWPRSEDVWARTRGWWVPSLAGDSRDDGTGWWSDAEISASLHRATAAEDATKRFVPALPGDRLPGRPIRALPPAVDRTAQYVLDHQANRLVPIRELVAAYDEDAAHDIPGVLTAMETARVLSRIDAEHDPVRVQYDEDAGRIYARYQRPSDFGVWTDAGFPPVVTCLHVFVLAGSPAKAA